MKKILITGGAGFIGENLTRKLLKLHPEFEIRILDNLNSQVHIDKNHQSETLKDVEFILGDIRDSNTVRKALNGITDVIHLAAETGTGQSMYEIEKYFSVNVQGTALLIELIQKEKCHNIDRIILASSRAIYGEGAYECKKHKIIYPKQRDLIEIERGNFEILCPYCSDKLTVIATPEDAPMNPTSVYGLTKQFQEQLVLMTTSILNLKGIALRFQNVYGPGQSLINPYTGILAIFTNLIRQGLPLDIYEDGHESRDFIYIDDVVDSIISSLNYSGHFTGSINVGSGVPTPVIDVANKINNLLNNKSQIIITGKYRVGDIRHNYADINSLKELLNVVPKVEFNVGLDKFVEWALEQPILNDGKYKKSLVELNKFGIMKG